MDQRQRAPDVRIYPPTALVGIGLLELACVVLYAIPRTALFGAMLLTVDIGNTNITIGAFDGPKLVDRWRLRTIHEQTADEWGILMRNLFSLSALDLSQVHGVVISSVVPAVDQPLTAMAERYFERQPMFVTPATDTGIKVLYDNPREVGADRVVNGVAAFSKYGGPCIIVDL